jgi:hypothetical protein
MPKKKSAPAAMLDLTIGHWIARLTYVAVGCSAWLDDWVATSKKLQILTRLVQEH